MKIKEFEDFLEKMGSEITNNNGLFTSYKFNEAVIDTFANGTFNIRVGNLTEFNDIKDVESIFDNGQGFIIHFYELKGCIRSIIISTK